MTFVVLYGTESGNAELVADEVADALAETDETQVCDLQDFDVWAFKRDSLYLILCSTHGEGDLPTSAQPFAAALDAEQPNLEGVRFAMFGLGNSTYANYSRGSELLEERLRTLGASRVGAYGRHDASARGDASELAIQWATDVVAEESQSPAL